jgi:hypothetical protein
MRLIDKDGVERDLPKADEELEDVVADALRRYGPDRHIDGYQEIAALVLFWAKRQAALGNL